MLTDDEKCKIINLALVQEVRGYKQDEIVKGLRKAINMTPTKLHEMFSFLDEHKTADVVNKLRLELLYLSAQCCNPMSFHPLERV